MAVKKCIGNYFLIILLIVLFGFLYVYISNFRLMKERFYEENSSKYIIPTDKLAVIQGVNLPNQPIESVSKFDKDPSAPPVDGKSGQQQMFMMAFNKVSPDCCPSTYSTSKGCVCLTDDQINWINNRGITRASKNS